MIAAPTREPNGRRKRLPRAEEALVAQTASQPHRRGEWSVCGATPWQRAIRAGTIAIPTGTLDGADLELAGLRFLGARANYLKAIAAPRGFAVSDPGQGGDLPPSLRQRWLKDWRLIRTQLGKRRLRALLAVIEAHPDTDERQWPTDFTIAVSDALASLCYHPRIESRRNPP